MIVPLVALVLATRAEAHSWPKHCRDAKAPLLCKIHKNAHKVNHLRQRMGEQRRAYHWYAEGHPAARPRILRSWILLRKQTERRWHAYQAQPWPAVWYQAAMCVHSHEGAWDSNTGNGYFGGMQFSLSTWQSAGGIGRPDLASPSTQLRVAYRLWQAAGWAPWPNTSVMCGL